MLSSDKNVESLAQLVTAIKDYIGLQKEYLKFDVIDKLVRLVTALALAIIFFILMIAILFYLSFATVYWMEPHTGTACAFAIVAAFFLFLLCIIFSFRKKWIERPLIRFMTKTLLG